MPSIVNQTHAFAIVIGISAYADTTNISPLDGCVPDAIAYVNWLLSIGVPASNIDCHLGYDSAKRAQYQFPNGVHIQQADEESVWNSFKKFIGADHAERLYICASGHGVQTDDGTCFLLQDFALQNASRKNICIEKYIKELLHGLNFDDQFLFIDCCSNFLDPQSMKQTVTSGGPQQVLHESFSTNIHTYYACGKEEKAQQKDGRGIFSKTLIDMIIPEAVNQLWNQYRGRRYFSFDFEHGKWCLDLNTLFTDKISSLVHLISQEIDRPFTPRSSSRGKNKDGIIPLYEFDALPVATLQISTNPETDLRRIRRVNAILSGVFPEWNGLNPSEPITLKIPTNRTVRIFGDPKDDCDELKNDPLLLKAEDGRAHTAELEFKPPPPPKVGNNNVDAISTKQMGGESVFGSNENFSSDGPTAESSIFASNEESIFIGHVGKTHVISKKSRDAYNLIIDRKTSKIRRIEGKISNWAKLTIRTMSSDKMLRVELDGLKQGKKLNLAPDRYLVEVALPWGTWREMLFISRGETSKLVIPENIKNAPLRFEPDSLENNTWTLHKSWLKTYSIDIPLINIFDKIPVRRSVGDPNNARFEPFSATTSPLWDILITNRRPEFASEEMLQSLISTPPNDIEGPQLNLLRLAAAYVSIIDGRTDLGKSLFQKLPDALKMTIDGCIISDALGPNENSPQSVIQKLETGEIPILNYGFVLISRKIDIRAVSKHMPIDNDLNSNALTVIRNRSRYTG